MTDRELQLHADEIRAELAELRRKGEYERLQDDAMRLTGELRLAFLMTEAGQLNDDAVAQLLERSEAPEALTTVDRRDEIARALARAETTAEPLPSEASPDRDWHRP
jgi:hypothetical protein